MGSETVGQIPLVDLSSEHLNPGSSSWRSACNDIRKALEQYGCFEVVYNNPSIEFHNRVLALLEKLFQLPQEIKMKNVNPKPAHGYMGKMSIFPIHEGMGIEYANDKDECQKFTNLMWPEGNDHFCDTVHSYAKMVTELQQLLVKMLFESYGIEKHSESHIKSTTYLLRLLKYRRSQAETNLGFKGHTDKSFLSILHQNHVKGLEIRMKDGNWVSYEPSSHTSFVVVAGDVGMAWSNDRIKSCYHRVTVDGEEVRYALGLFSFLTGLVKVPEELIDEEHPLQYKPFEHQGLLDFYQSNNSQNKGDSNMVKAYCGV
ncbi:probable 2-oxoglutarate-dependent dioxygenase AOP1 [Ricinus communis]|uniref:Gibberellin 20 oxidase, putative n=1 Tax=Ricinus communis TaxID=3988 RepID=B9RUX8_RICCO|nr:probable 2-oxoglutarate-dependent dioxygenase AOP1 [Ricinus communis]EEF44711.1 Gibberellin 20 oxidase, putative [Ricinus communis]|eukprot:XP_002517547.1 probable 2-oxoglutarate-dependent dioxygenase AOP1 [Ricinus communis]